MPRELTNFSVGEKITQVVEASFQVLQLAPYAKPL